jgi:arylsulfatase A-like enzyme
MHMQGIPRNMTGMATKLASAGYATHMVGKWDAGMATPDHTPYGRGYRTSLNYFNHCNDYWTSTVAACREPGKGVSVYLACVQSRSCCLGPTDCITCVQPVD